MARKLLIKYNYLIKTIVSFCIVLYIPLIFFGFFVIQGSYDELIKANEAYYHDITESYAIYFSELVNNLREHALRISLENKDTDSKLSKETIESHPYYYYTTAKILNNYKMAYSSSTDLGLFFLNTDYILTSAYKYSVEEFKEVFKVESFSQEESFLRFLALEDTDISFCSTFTNSDIRNARLLIGKQVTINSRYKTIIFNILKQDSISTSIFDPKNPNQLTLSMFDSTGNLIYTNKLIDNNLYASSDFKEFIDDKAKNLLKTQGLEKNYTVFKTYNNKLKMTFLSIVPQYQVEANYAQFYSLSRKATFLIFAVLLVLLVAIAYFNYKPILKIINNLRKSSEGGVTDEIKTIIHAFDRMEEYVSEHKILLMDYFLNNLLYGIPIPREDAEKLDINLPGSFFGVITVPDLKMNTKDREVLASHILSLTGSNVYITDIFRKDHLVIICVLKDPSVENIVRALKQYIADNYNIILPTGVGHVVEKLDDIRKSYMNALHTMESVAITNTAVSTEIPYVTNYPSENIAMFLQSLKSGEFDEAMEKLAEIIDNIKEEIETSHIQRYICYDILIAYIKCLKQINYPLGEKEALDLLTHCNVNELYEYLHSSVKLVCESINKSMNTIEDEIVDYVNKNFNDQEICRTQVADNFGISIYTLSRLFKSKTGIGFKEYINAKRMEMARHLLITTDKTITELSAEVGFMDPDYFSKLFKANYEVTPSKFREL